MNESSIQEISVSISYVNPSRSRPRPEYMSPGAAGLDLYAAIDSPLTIKPGEVKLVGTGFSIAIPPGYEGQVRPRSGLALKHSIGILNSPGTVDSDYRGEVSVILFNFGDTPYTVQDGDRIAQMVIAAVPKVNVVVVDHLNDTKRGTGGYGHTGR